MRIMLDTNVLISMVLFPDGQFRKMLDYITRNHRLVLSSYVVDELLAVTYRKFPTKKKVIDAFLSDLSYELVYTPHNMQGNLFKIRDMKDYPVLYVAIVENIDIFISGDKDFQDVDVEMPEILSPADFMNKYIK